MTRREFRLISAAGAGPSVEDITRRPSTRRHFKTIVAGAARTKNTVRAVTIKGIDKTDGETVWEYGPGSFWRHHYGADAISGVKPDVTAEIDKYAICAAAYPAFANCGNRNAATLVANVSEALKVVKLNSLDGTEVESATLQGMFCSEVSGVAYSLVLGLRIDNAAALSGGDYVIVGERLPFIEFVSFASNAATKEYILHAHGQQAGNVYLKTRTSNETITIPYNATAAAVETLFEATTDCTAATATGGPWPLKPITVEATWSVAGGDVSAISATNLVDIESTGASAYDELTEFPMVFGWEWKLTVDNVNVGTEFIIYFDGSGGLPLGDQFSYTSTTDDPVTFVANMHAAFVAFLSANALDDDWSEVYGHDFDANTMTINYYTVARHLQFEIVDDPPTLDTRRAGSCAASYDTGTGEMLSAVGYKFGYSAARAPTKMFSETGSLPTMTGLDVLGILSIGSGPSNSVIVTPEMRNNGDSVKSNVVEKWNIASGVWTYDWQAYCNATMLMPFIIPCESGYVLCPIAAKRFDGARDRTATKLQVSDGAITEVMTYYGSLNVPDNVMATQMFDDLPNDYLSWGFEVTYEDNVPGTNTYTINDKGIDTWADGSSIRLGAIPFAADATQVYANRPRHITGDWRYDAIGDNTDSDLQIKFLAPYTSRSAEPQQFRFVLDRMPGTNYTSWLDWYSTESQIETAFNALLGSGNVSLIDFGLDPTPVVNNPVALIEFNPLFEFKTDRGFTPGSGRIPVGYFQFRNDGALLGGVRIEMQTITPFTSPAGIAAYSITNATKVWSRAFGTKGAATIQDPTHAWLQGNYIYAYGTVVDSEL
jgi:hypothetical protein